MTENQLLIGYVAGAIALLQAVPYLISIIRGHTKPERATYAIWSLVNVLTMASYIAAGARTTIWVGLAFTTTSIVVFLLSFKFGMGGLNKFDAFCLGLAAVGIVIWLTTSDPALALYFYIGVKALGYLPTLKKVYYYPKTENTLSWIMVASASVLNLFAITSWTPQIALFPLYAVAADLSLAVILVTADFHARKSLRRKLIGLYEV